jgi:hypothetical protein
MSQQKLSECVEKTLKANRTIYRGWLKETMAKIEKPKLPKDKSDEPREGKAAIEGEHEASKP